MTTQRSFTAADRRSAFIAANGLCQSCGKPLPKDFHADHKLPFSKGGATTLDNIQALCPECNLKKGDKVNVWTPDGLSLRPWQIDAFNAYLRKCSKSKNFLAQVTPGGGKTIFACAVARHLLDRGVIDRVLVVSPSVTLREIWADEMSLFGIELDPECGSNKERTSEFIGKSTTYQSLMMVDNRNSGAQVEFILQNQNKTLAILDEIHHAGDSLSWGNGLRYACQNAEAILCLSGTPFRTDGNPIPFVEYQPDGMAVADYVYSYQSALSDHPQVCRAVYFPLYEGNLAWVKNDQIYSASFADDLDENLESQRLKAALWSGEWVESTIRDAQSKLSDIRAHHHPDAAGLIVAMDKKHASHLAQIIRRISFSEPLVVTSDDPEASAQIKAFRTKTDPWIIAIKMVSEGVDIKRLRVCVYLSNVVTELFFRQVVGRVVRYIPGIRDQEAFFYIPSDRRLVEMVMRLRDERIKGLLKDPCESQEEDDPDFYQDELWDDLFNESSFHVLSGECWHNSTITHDGDVFSSQELTAAAAFAKQNGFIIMPEQMAKILRYFTNSRSDPVNGQKAEPVQEKPAYQKHREAREKRIDQERKWLTELRERWFPHLSKEEGFKRLNGGLKRHFGAKDQLTIEQVKLRHEFIEAAVMNTSSTPTWAL